MGLERQVLCCVDNDFGGGVAAARVVVGGHVDGAGAVLVVQPRVGSHELNALLALETAAAPCAACALAGEHDGGEEGEGREEAGCAGGGAEAGAKEGGVFCREGEDGGFGGGGPQRGLCGHVRG